MTAMRRRGRDVPFRFRVYPDGGVRRRATCDACGAGVEAPLAVVAIDPADADAILVACDTSCAACLDARAAFQPVTDFLLPAADGLGVHLGRAAEDGVIVSPLPSCACPTASCSCC